ncbi:MAG: YIP1 family protein, partial [Chlamydiia bacterium]
MNHFPPLKELLLIVVKPREVIRKIVQADARKYFLVIAYLLGLIGIFDMASMSDLGGRYDLGSIILMAAIFALPYGYAILSLFSLAVFWVSRLFKGRANYYQTRAAITWALAPRILNLIFWGVNIALVGVLAFHL